MRKLLSVLLALVLLLGAVTAYSSSSSTEVSSDSVDQPSGSGNTTGSVDNPSTPNTDGKKRFFSGFLGFIESFRLF